MEISRGDLDNMLKSIRRAEWQEVKGFTRGTIKKNKKKYTRKDKRWKQQI